MIIVSNSNDNGPGSLRQAISDASSGDVIEFQSDYNITLEAELAINKDLTVNSLGKNITISGNNKCRVFNIESGGVTINRIFITNGRSNTAGGAIYNSGTLTITNSTLYGNDTSSFGGAISNESGTLTITNSTLSGNTSNGYGGAIDHFTGTLTITNSTLSGNASNYGGQSIIGAAC